MGRIKKEEFESHIIDVATYYRENKDCSYMEFMVSNSHYKQSKILFYIDSILYKLIQNYIDFINNADYITQELDLKIDNGQHISYQPTVSIIEDLDTIYINLCEYSMFFIDLGDDRLNGLYHNRELILAKIDGLILLVKDLEVNIHDNPLLMYYIENNDYIYNIFELFECIYNKKSFKTLIYEPRAI